MDITPLTNAVNDGSGQAGDTVQDIFNESTQIDIAAAPPMPDTPVMSDAPIMPAPQDFQDTPSPISSVPAIPPAPDAGSAAAPAIPVNPPSDQTLEELEKAVADKAGEMVDLPELPAIDNGSVDVVEELSSDSSEGVASVSDASATPVSSLSGDAARESSGDTELDAIKAAALKDLAPIVDKLDQPPEEKFNTMVMLLQSSDDKQLVKPAYEAARGISDEAKRAQALLDVVNEVNYLEHKKD